jgi:hypothetical protein
MTDSNNSVEAIISQVKAMNVESRATFELWVPQDLTLDGEPTPQDVAMALVGDQLLDKGFEPDGFTDGEGGRTYKYRLRNELDNSTAPT